MIADARVAAGGVATVPWKLGVVEDVLRGKPATQETFEVAAALATEGAKPLSGNASMRRSANSTTLSRPPDTSVGSASTTRNRFQSVTRESPSG